MYVKAKGDVGKTIFFITLVVYRFAIRGLEEAKQKGSVMHALTGAQTGTTE